VFLEKKLPEACGYSFTGLQLILQVSSENISPQLTTIAGMNGAGLWLCLPGPHFNGFFLWVHIKALIQI
jgi:hypothetical protein